MADSRPKSGITARDVLRHPMERGTAESPAPTLAGPVYLSTPLEDIVALIRAADTDEIEVLDESGRLEGRITREGVLRTLLRIIEELTEERRVLQLAVERQRQALEDTGVRLNRIRETLDLVEEIRRGSTEVGPALQHALEEIGRILSDARRA